MAESSDQTVIYTRDRRSRQMWRNDIEEYLRESGVNKYEWRQIMAVRFNSGSVVNLVYML